MKILQILYSLTSGGAERLVLDLSNELSKNNEVHMLTILDDEIDGNGFYKCQLSQKIRYYNAKENRGKSIHKFLKISQKVKEINPDIVHIHGQGIFLYCLPSILFNRKPKYIETLHTSADVLFNSWHSFIFKIIFKINLIKLVTVSDENKLGLERVTNIKNSTLIYNGRSEPIPSTSFNQVKTEIDALKKNKDDIVFINVGRCVWQKNQKMLIEVFNKLEIGHILLILGDNFESELGMGLKDTANSNIHFLGTKLNIIDYYLCSDAFCLTSIVEGMPISLIEAFACGCVPICTPTSGSSDHIVDGKNGFISEDFSENSYIEAMKRFINSRLIFKKEFLRQTYLDVFSMETCSKAYYQLYEKSLKSSNNN